MPPKIIRPFLWSSDMRQIDLRSDRRRIILNILNLGTKEATDWLFSFYSRAAIRQALIRQGAKGELSGKSLNYWSLVLGVKPGGLARSRF